MSIEKAAGLAIPKRWKNLLICFALGFIVWFLPNPSGVDIKAWHLFAIFLATIASFILQPFPMGTMALAALVVSIFSGVLTFGQAVSGFGSGTVWLVLSAFLFSIVVLKSGLGLRIAYLLIKYFGNSSLALGYIVVVTDLFLSPAMASNTARASSIFPIAKSLCSALNSEPGNENNDFGSFLMTVEFQGNCITSAAFMTAMGGTPLALSLAKDAVGIDISWALWTFAAFVPVLLALAVVPLIVYKLNTPNIKDTSFAKQIASEKLHALGPLSMGEKITLGVFLLVVVLWSTTKITGLNVTGIAMLAVVLSVLFGLLEWKEDACSEKGAWDTFIWMGGIIGLASWLTKLGLIPWFANEVAQHLNGLSWPVILACLVVVYMYAHYSFASGTAHVVAMYVPFLTVAVSSGVPPMLAVLSLAFVNPIFQGLTHYSMGCAPIYYGAGYTSQGKWWLIGFVVSVVNLLIFVALGSVWWKIIGLW